MMEFDVRELDPDDLYFLLIDWVAPRPIAWVSRSLKVYKTARTCSRPLTWKGGTTLASHPYPIP
jgi:hypothetical protein